MYYTGFNLSVYNIVIKKNYSRITIENVLDNLRTTIEIVLDYSRTTIKKLIFEARNKPDIVVQSRRYIEYR